jgi:hypothetical protein
MATVWALAWAAALLLCLPAVAQAASEVFPGSFEAASPGTRVASLYYYQRSLEGYYVNGTRWAARRWKARPSWPLSACMGGCST